MSFKYFLDMAPLEENKIRLEYDKIISEIGLARVSIVGTGLSSIQEVNAMMYKAHASVNIFIKKVSTSETNVSFMISVDMTEKAVQTLHCFLDWILKK
jgi:aspartate kinase